jgi:hypothetical protein
LQQKGSAIRSTLRAIRAMYGDDTLAAVMARVPRAVRAQLEPVVLATSWYPIETVAAVHVAIRNIIGHGDWEVSRAIGAAASREDYSGIHRALFHALDLDIVFSRGQATWNRYHTQGRVTWSNLGKGTAEGFIDEVDGFNPGVWNAVAGRIQTMFEIVGARAAIVDVKSPLATACEFQVSWVE